jgi:hypothetical protein
MAHGGHPVLAIKNAKIGDFNGRTLSSISSTVLTVDPDIPEAGALRHWCAPLHALPLPPKRLPGAPWHQPETQ